MIPLLLAFWFAPQERPVEKATLSGTVVNSVTREPLSKVTVLAEPAVKGAAASTVTDANGRFELVDLEPGQYRVKGRRNAYVETYYGARRSESKGTAIALERGQQWKDLQIKLLPCAVIAGTIRDSDGEPLVGAYVAIVSLQYSEGVREYSTETKIETDDLGQYRAIVAPGRYYVRAEHEEEYDAAGSVDHSKSASKARERLLPMFYPGVRDPGAARLLYVEAGTRVTAIDVTLPRSRVFRVNVHVDAPAGLNPHAELHAGKNGERINFRSENKGRGNFEFRNVPPGSYVLEAVAPLPAMPATNRMEMMFGADRTYRSRMSLEVGNADVEGIRIAVAPGAEILAKIAVEGGNPPKLTDTRLRFTNAAGHSDFWIRDDNTFHAARSPGHYDLHVMTVPGLITKSIRSDTVDVLNEGLTIAGPGKISLEIVMSRDSGQVDGVIFDKDEKPVPGATVVLIPEPARRNRWDLFLTSTADQYGRYELKSVTPGEYKLIAWDDVEPGSWFDSDFLKEAEKYGSAVTIQSKGRETVKLHLVPALKVVAQLNSSRVSPRGL